MALALSRNKQFGIKLEGTAGTAETLTSADYGLELTELSVDTGLEVIENDVFKNSLSSSTSRIGKKTATATIAGEFKNSGTLNTLPKIDPLLQIARMIKLTVRGMVFSAGSGTAVRGVSYVSGGTSSAKGYIVKIEASKVYIAVVSGTFQSGEALTTTGTGSTWVATAGTQDAALTGFAYMPASTSASEKTATINVLDGGFLKPSFGDVASIGLELSTDGYPKWTASISGIMGDTWGDAGSEVIGITYESNQPAIVNNATLLINGTIAPITSKVTIDLGNTLSVLKDLNSSTWLKYGVVSDRATVGTLDVMAIAPATYDLYAALFAGTTASLEFVIGSGAGKAVEIVLPAIQYQGVTSSDDAGFLANQISFKATGRDNEMLIWFR
jgi:hypothetical protein